MYVEYESKDGWIIRVNEGQIKKIWNDMPKVGELKKDFYRLQDKVADWAQMRYIQFLCDRLGLADCLSVINEVRKDTTLKSITGATDQEWLMIINDKT